MSKISTTTNDSTLLPTITLDIKLLDTSNISNILLSHDVKLTTSSITINTFTSNLIKALLSKMPQPTAEFACARNKLLSECNSCINEQDLVDAIALFRERVMTPFIYLNAENLESVEANTAWCGKEKPQLKIGKWRWKCKEDENGDAAVDKKIEKAAEHAEEEQKNEIIAECLVCPRGGPAAGFCAVM